MAGTSKTSDASRLVQGLFTLGATGQMSDGQLLERFLAHRDEGFEAAFEELMNRHGPMVLRVCRGVLRDHHDAEDAFQAAFLVLAHQAGSIRRQNSLASWLFGVAQRVAAHAKLRAARGHEAERTAGSKRGESYELAGDPDQLEPLQEEIARLPDHLRAPITLCYLEGLDYQQAALRLGLSEAAVRGRLARARERLRRGLVRRGAAISATLMLAGEASQAQPAVPASLVRSTLGIASGFITGKTAATLARGVIRSMFLHRLKAAVVFLALSVGSGFWALHILAAGQDNKEQRVSGPQAVPDQKLAEKPVATYRLTGSVRVEGTGEPIAGARMHMYQLQKHPGISNLDLQSGPIPWTEIRTGSNGEFSFEPLPGTAVLSLRYPPLGYWFRYPSLGFERLAFGPDSRGIRKDFILRPGTVWKFRLSGATKSSSSTGMIGVQRFSGAEFDGEGLAYLTLPSEGGKFSISVDRSRWSPYGPLGMTLEAAPGFRPDSLMEISRDPNAGCGFRMIDSAGRLATLQAPAFLEAVNEQGKLVIRIDLPDPDHWDVGEIVGQVVDDEGRQIEGARIYLFTNGMWRGEQGRWTTDAQGRYDLLSVPRRCLDGSVPRQLAFATKEGFCGGISPAASFDLRAAGKPLNMEPIRLYPGVELRGEVVDHQGRPVAGATVTTHCLVFFGPSAEVTFTDERGRFVCRNLRAGPARVVVEFGALQVRQLCLADGSTTEVRI